MSNRKDEVLVNFATRRRRAKMITKKDANQSIDQARNMPAIQVDVTRVC